MSRQNTHKPIQRKKYTWEMRDAKDMMFSSEKN